MSTPPIPRLKKMVETILSENPKFLGVEARNSDIALTVLIWQRWYLGEAEQGEYGKVFLARLFDLPREDNVKRIRAVFQNTEHKYLPTDPSILVKRGIEEAYWFDALGYNLTPDEWRIHRQTAKETTPPASKFAAPAIKAAKEYVDAVDNSPQIPSENDMLIAGETKMKPFTVPATEPRPVVYTTKMKAIYLPKSYGSSALQTGQEYEIEVEQLATGKPIKMIAPIEAVYPNLQSFGKTWKVVG